MTFEVLHGQDAKDTLTPSVSLSHHHSNCEQSKEISLDGLFQLCIKRGVFRIIKEESNSKHLTLTICGVFRIVKNLKTESVHFQLLHQKNGRMDWRVTRNAPYQIPLFFRNGYFVNDWVSFAIKRTLDLLLLDGYTIKGSVWLWDVDMYNETVFFSSTNPAPFKELGFNEAQVISKKIRDFTLSSKEEVGAPEEYYCQCQSPDLKSLIHKAISFRCWSILDIKTRDACGRSLAYLSWHYVKKQQCSQYLKACHSARSSTVFYSSLDSYLDFCKKIKIDSSNVDNLGSLWPFIGLLMRNKGPYYISGKVRELYDLISPSGLSYGDFKSLKNGPIKICASIIDMPSDQFMRDNVDPLKPTRHSVFHFDQEDCLTAIKITRHPLSKQYPVTVILSIINRLISYWVPDNMGDKIYRVCTRWLDYNKDLYKRIGFKQSRFRWGTEINYLGHVLDWVRMVNPEIHKNQSWHSFWRLTEEWTRQHRSSHGESDLPTEWPGTGVDWGDGILELNSEELLKKEGFEMEHCIAAYHSQCAKGTYYAFSVQHKGERSTLGIMKISSGIMIDQVRGVHNSAVSSAMENHCKKILKTISSQADHLN